MVDIVLGSCHSFIFLHSRGSGEFALGLEDALFAGKGPGEDRRNGAASRPVVAAREGKAREERVREKRKVFFLTGIVIPLLEEEGLLRARRHSVPE